MEPFFFGNSGKTLFGVYHQPVAQNIRDMGVVLCYPGPQEYMSAHWAFRRLAGLLSQSGFHVLRFDYFGTGDSSGESTRANIAQWRTDIGTAVKELVDMSRVRGVSLMGGRLGAALAVQATIGEIRLKNLVLWDPVVIGEAYIRELRALHEKFFAAICDGSEKREFTELLGYPVSAAMISEIEKINLLKQPHCMAEKVFIIASEERKEYLELATEYETRGTAFEYRFVPDSTKWGSGEDFDQALLLNDVIHEIVAVIAGV